MTSPPTPVLRMTAIEKRFPGTVALDGVDLELEAGTIHGLLGENGAGKSTLLKILAGDYRPSSGTIELDGKVVEIDNPRTARMLGLGIVYQELSLLPNLSVAHNISLGSEPTHTLQIDEHALRATASEVLGRMGVRSIDPGRTVSELSLPERQLVEIAKVLTLRRPRVLIFDEPTTALNHHDVERLFRIMRSLRDDGVALVFVSHRYREVLEICDVSTVLRNGRVVGRVARGEATLERLVELTLGQKAEAAFRRDWRAPADAGPVLEARGLRVGGRVLGVDLQVRRGEIVGVCGLLGSGQDELARAIFGDARDVSGALLLHGGVPAPRSPREAVAARVALITESRQEEGLFPDMPVRSNISIASLGRLVAARALRLIDGRRERRQVTAAAERTGIDPRALSRNIRTLSGGNQQKSLLARWLMHGCELLVCLEPTRGVDVGAKVEIYRQLEGLARDGAGVLVVSTDLPEILGLSDRVVVLWRGRVQAELDPRTATEQDLLLAMQGGAEGEQRGLLEVPG
jgi:ABC-type sugar transport system ATPase subunit